MFFDRKSFLRTWNALLTSAMIGLATGMLAWGLSQQNASAHTVKVPTDLNTSINKPKLEHKLFLPIVLSNYVQPVQSIFGIQTYGRLDSPMAGITLAQEAHVRWVRTDMAWSVIEPNNTVPTNYNLSAYDASILAAKQAGFELVVTILGNPSWAATYPQGPIDRVSLSEFTDFINAVVRRYNGDPANGVPGVPEVRYWEFYNEPDNSSRISAGRGEAGYWGNYGAEYAHMLCTVYPVIKAANPRAQVVIGGLAYDWFEDQGGPFVREFLDNVLAAGGGQCFDIMNFHYYPAFEAHWSPYGPGLSGKANYLRSKLTQFGVSKPMICTEAGWRSDMDSTPEIQTRYVIKLFTQSRASRLEHTMWWTWIDPGSWYGAFGLLTQDRKPKPSFYGCKTAAEKIGGAIFNRALSTTELGDPAMEGYLFTLNLRSLYVLWSNDGVTRTISISLPRAKLTDLYGNDLGTINAGSGGRINVSVGANPVYVEALP